MGKNADKMALSADFLAEAWRKRKQFLRRHGGEDPAAIRAIACDGADQWLVSATDLQQLRIWSVADGRLVQTLPVPAGEPGTQYAVAIRPDGQVIAWGGWSDGQAAPHRVTLIDRASGASLGQLGPFPDSVTALDFAPDGQALAVGLAGTSGVRLFDLASGTETARDDEFGDAVQVVQFNPLRENDPFALAASSHDRYVRLYDGDLDIVGVVPMDGPATGLAFGPRRLAVGFQEQQRLEWLNFDEQDSLALSIPDDDEGDLAAVALLADGRIIAGGTWGDAQRQTCLWVVAPEDGANGVAWPIGHAPVQSLVALAGGGVIAATHDGELIRCDGQGKILWRVAANQVP